MTEEQASAVAALRVASEVWRGAATGVPTLHKDLAACMADAFMALARVFEQEQAK